MWKRIHVVLFGILLWILAKLGSDSGQQKVVSTEPVECGAGADNIEGEEEEHLCVDENNISVVIYFFFPKYRLLTIQRHTVEGRVMQLARLDALIAALLTCLVRNEMQDMHTKRSYEDTFISHVSE